MLNVTPRNTTISGLSLAFISGGFFTANNFFINQFHVSVPDLLLVRTLMQMLIYSSICYYRWHIEILTIHKILTVSFPFLPSDHCPCCRVPQVRSCWLCSRAPCPPSPSSRRSPLSPTCQSLTLSASCSPAPWSPSYSQPSCSRWWMSMSW